MFSALVTLTSKSCDLGLVAYGLPAQFPENLSEKWVKDLAEGISYRKNANIRGLLLRIVVFSFFQPHSFPFCFYLLGNRFLMTNCSVG